MRCSVCKAMLTQKRHTILGKVKSLCRGQVDFPLKGPNQLVTMAMELHPLNLVTHALCKRRGAWRGHMWDVLILTTRGLYDGHTEQLLQRHIDTYVKMIHQMGGTIWWTVLPPSLASWPPLASVSWAKHQLYTLAVLSWHFLQVLWADHVKSFPTWEKDSCLMAIWNTSCQSTNTDSMPHCFQPSMRPLTAHLKKTFQIGKLLFHSSEYTCK